MSSREDKPDRGDLAEEAREWVSRLASGEASADDTAAMMRWRAQSPEHARALGEAVRLRRRVMAAGEALRAESEARWLLSRPSRQPSRVIGRRALIGGAVAASAAAVLVIRPPLGLWPSLAELQADYRTAIGERRTFAIAPGVTVELNTRTSLARRDDERTFRLALISGEVAVDARSPTRPAAISTAAGEALASAGRFDVRIQAHGTCVTCFAGEVAVTGAANERFRLAGGQQVTLGGAHPAKVAHADVMRAEAWRRGELIFTGDPLSSVIDEINRYRPGKIILTNAALGHIPISAVFRLNAMDNAVSQLREVANASVTNLPGGVVFLS